MLGVKCNNEPPQETQTLMAHHLIALLFSSAQYTTSRWMKPTHPVHHHARGFLFLHINEIAALLSSPPCPTCHFWPIFFQCPLLYPPLPLLLLSSLCLSVSLWRCPPSFRPRFPSFGERVPLVSGGLAGRPQKWLWGWGMAALFSLADKPSNAYLQSRQCGDRGTRTGTG